MYVRNTVLPQVFVGWVHRTQCHSVITTRRLHLQLQQTLWAQEQSCILPLCSGIHLQRWRVKVLGTVHLSRCHGLSLCFLLFVVVIGLCFWWYVGTYKAMVGIKQYSQRLITRSSYLNNWPTCQVCQLQYNLQSRGICCVAVKDLHDFHSEAPTWMPYRSKYLQAIYFLERNKFSSTTSPLLQKVSTTK